MKKLLALTLAVLMVMSLTGCQSSDYKKAVTLKDSGDAAAAAEMFKALGDYQDSAELLKDCEYTLAKAAYDAKEYETAAEAFRALGDYKDSAELLQKASDTMITAELLGIWEGEKDLAEYFFTSIGIMVEAEGGTGLDYDGLTCKVNMKFMENGTVLMQQDSSTFADAIESMLDRTTEVLYKVYEDLLKENGVLELVLKDKKTDNVREAIDALLGAPLRESLGNDATVGQAIEEETELHTGVFTVENGTITVTFDETVRVGVLEDGVLNFKDNESPASFTKA